ncbi:uncharacterized protein LOC122503211 [Leptopilina heterotoma]|uniref:uncharacterized protein LOC122503211 n=1 Tax=Leptopilina heterotoma TaxID=63436 RepID=UPI001CA7D732|nr:uncharacterized protein LOC122503211 [Leptopilina heterotoma]
MEFEAQSIKLPVYNFDTLVQDCNKKTENRHGNLLPNSVRAIFCGPSNCGKTNALLALLIHPNGLRFENFHSRHWSINMSSTHLKHLRKQKDILGQIAKASDAIRRKHRLMKLGKEEIEQTLSNTFKPIVTLIQKLVDDIEIVKQIRPVKIEREGDLPFEFEEDQEFKSTETSNRGPPGLGFKLTAEGDFNIENKKLCNVADAESNAIEDQKLQLVKELHKPARKNYKRRSVDIRGFDETWQADLVEMQPYARENKGYKYLLTVIDTFSKFAWAVPVKSKKGENVTAAMKSILIKKRIPKNLQVDKGKEFYNLHFENLIKNYNINLYSTHSNLKASICERFNRTLKNKMWMQFSLRGNYKWIDILSDLVNAYNNSKHRTIKMKPMEVNAENENNLLFNVFRKVAVSRQYNKFKVGDRVRISKVKHVFEKGYTPNWTTEIFTISDVKNTNPITYILSDYQENLISGCFYDQELSKVKYPDVYLVEKVLKKRGSNVFVKWLGFDNSHNSWINESDL